MNVDSVAYVTTNIYCGRYMFSPGASIWETVQLPSLFGHACTPNTHSDPCRDLYIGLCTFFIALQTYISLHAQTSVINLRVKKIGIVLISDYIGFPYGINN